MKWKSKLYSLYSVLLAFVLLLSPMSSIGSLASTTSGSVPEELFEYTENYIRDNFNALCRYVVRQNAIISDAIVGTWDNFLTWLDSSGNGDIWEQHPHSPIRIVNGVDNVEVPQEVLNVLNEYVIYQIQQNPLSYTPCYIYSYRFLDPTLFPNYQSFINTQTLIKDFDGYTFLQGFWDYGSNGKAANIAQLTRNVDIGWVGTTLNGGFTNVRPYVNWLAWSPTVTRFYINTARKEVMNTSANLAGTKNVSSLNTNSYTVFSNYEKNELVYVFDTLNAYKNYNSGMPQGYYLTSEGISNSMSNWSVGSGTINTGTLSTANSSYSSVVNNVQSGWTAEEVLQLVNMISNNSGSGSGGSGNGSDDDGWLDLGIFGDIGKAIAKVIGAIITAIASIFEEIIGIVTQVSETLLQGVIFEFLSAFIGWLPDEIIALLTALFSVAVLFALVKLIREAF